MDQGDGWVRQSRLSERHFRSIAEIIETQFGIQRPAAKRTMLEGRPRKRVRSLHLASLDAYGRHLFDQGCLADEFVHLVDCMTANKTDFFREPRASPIGSFASPNWRCCDPDLQSRPLRRPLRNFR